MNSKATTQVHVVEDDAAVRQSVVELLRLNNFDARGYEGPADFFDAYDGAPGCLLIDIMLKGCDGRSVARSIMSGPSALGVVFMTGSVDPELRNMAAPLDSAALLLKPFSAQALVAAVTRATPGVGPARGEPGERRGAGQPARRPSKFPATWQPRRSAIRHGAAT